MRTRGREVFGRMKAMENIAMREEIAMSRETDRQHDGFRLELELIEKIHKQKNEEYRGCFYPPRGNLRRAYFDMERKWDRLKAILEEGKVTEVPESIEEKVLLLEQLRDLAVYCLKTAQIVTGDYKGADLPTCAGCGSIMEPNGSCYKCPNCGETSGCS